MAQAGPLGHTGEDQGGKADAGDLGQDEGDTRPGQGHDVMQRRFGGDPDGQNRVTRVDLAGQTGVTHGRDPGGGGETGRARGTARCDPT